MNTEKSVRSNEILSEVFDFIHRENVLLVFDKSAHLPDFTYNLASEYLRIYGASLGWVCWRENAGIVKKRLNLPGCEPKQFLIVDTVGVIVEDKCTVLHSPKNYSRILMDIQRFFKDREYLLVLDNLDVIYRLSGKEIVHGFLSSILRKCHDLDVTTFSSLQSDVVPEMEMEMELFSLYDVIFYISYDTMRIKSDVGKRDYFYVIKSGKLLFKVMRTSNIEKIKEIFEISPEESEKLDKIVESKSAMVNDLV